MPNIPSRKPTGAYKAIPDPVPGDDSLYHAVTALKEVSEVLTRQRKPFLSAAVTFQDLVDMGLIGEDGRAMQDFGALLKNLADSSDSGSVFINRAYADVIEYGAVADGSADDSAAIQAAIDFVDGQGGGIVFFPKGGYKVLSTLHVNGAGTRLVGPGGNNGTSVIFTDDTDINAINLHGFSDTIENLIIQGGGFGSGNAAIKTSDDAVECQFLNLRVSGGAQCIDITTPDCIVWGGHWESAYANAIIQVRDTSGAYIIRVKADQNFPGDTPDYTPSARANSTAYALHDVVSLSGYYIQCTVAGTSAGSAPTLQNYGVDITDGSTLRWRLVAPTNYASLKLDHAFSCFVYGTDHTGPFENGILLSDDNTAGGPESCIITDTTIGQCFSSGIAMGTGNGNQVKGGVISGGIANGVGIYIGADDSAAIGVLIIGWDIGIILDAENTEAAHNQIFSTGVGVLVLADNTMFSITDNKLGSSTAWGQNDTPIVVDDGTSDNYIVSGNIGVGAVNGSYDGGTGTNKVFQNIE